MQKQDRPELAIYAESAAYLRAKFAAAGLCGIPDMAVILGSGLGAFADAQIVKRPIHIPYAEIPNFPVSTVSYQKGSLTAGYVHDHFVLLFNGRFHYYEGWEMWETAYPVTVCRLLGIDRMILTNAAGAINTDTLDCGDIVCIRDHIKLTPDSPVRGKNEDALGARFFDMQKVYDRSFIRVAYACAEAMGFAMKDGVYAYMAGPQFETPAEIRALKTLGADLVGMSTVAEVIEAAHVGIRVLALSCVSNAAAGITGQPMTEQEVLETAARTSARFQALIEALIERLCSMDAE